MHKLTIIYGKSNDAWSELTTDIYFEDDYIIKESVLYEANNLDEILVIWCWEDYSKVKGLYLSKKRVVDNIYFKTWFISSYDINDNSRPHVRIQPK